MEWCSDGSDGERRETKTISCMIINALFSRPFLLKAEEFMLLQHLLFSSFEIVETFFFLCVFFRSTRTFYVLFGHQIEIDENKKEE